MVVTGVPSPLLRSCLLYLEVVRRMSHKILGVEELIEETPCLILSNISSNHDTARFLDCQLE